MKEKRRKIEEIIQKYAEEARKYNSKFKQTFMADPIHMEIMIYPIENTDLARLTADKYGVEFKKYDFSEGKGSQRNYKPVFSAVVTGDESKFENIIKNLLNAKKEIYETYRLSLSGLARVS